MALVQYSTTELFEFRSQLQPFVLAITANGGAVLLEAEIDPGTFQTVTNFTADAVEQIVLSDTVFRLTPSGGATYSIAAEAK